MLTSLNFVKGAVAKAGFVPALTHFRISRGTVRGFNGQMALSSPIATDLDCSPNAKQFVCALNACKETVALHLKNGRLVVQSGGFKCNVDCDDPANFPDIVPSGRFFNVGPEFYDSLVTLEPFISEDENRPWSCGILLEAQSAFATNNIVAVECWHGLGLPLRVNLPADSVREILRVGEAPYRLQIEEHRISFHWPDGRWLATQLLTAEWPDIRGVIEKAQGTQEVANPQLFDALEQLLPLCEKGDACYFLGDQMATSAEPEAEGASVVMPCPAKGAYNARQLAKLRGLVQTVGWDAYPAPVPFFGATCRGVILGRKIT